MQIIEITTTRLDEIQGLMDEWVAKTEGKRRTNRATLTADRDKPNTYVQIVEFPSYEQAMENSNLPETSGFAEKLLKLCDEPQLFATSTSAASTSSTDPSTPRTRRREIYSQGLRRVLWSGSQGPVPSRGRRDRLPQGRRPSRLKTKKARSLCHGAGLLYQPWEGADAPPSIS